jgi:hypothetical protein
MMTGYLNLNVTGPSHCRQAKSQPPRYLAFAVMPKFLSTWTVEGALFNV